MKKVLALALLVAVSSQAAKFETCYNKVVSKCGVLGAVTSLSTAGTECSMVEGGKRENDGSHVADKVVFKDSNSLVSLTVSNDDPYTRQCDLNRVDIFGKFKKERQLAGRLFAVTQDGRVLVITRINSIIQLLNSKGKPYTSVEDIKIDQEAKTITLSFENGQKNELDLDDVLKKVATKDKDACITRASCRIDN